MLQILPCLPEMLLRETGLYVPAWQPGENEI